MKIGSFSPISQIDTFITEDELIAHANDTEYDLYASVFTKDINCAVKFVKEMEAGMVIVNGAARTSSYGMPFGVWKQSGVGTELSHKGFDRWTQIKSVIIVEQVPFREKLSFAPAFLTGVRD